MSKQNELLYEDYDEILLDSIKHLDKYSYLCGCEGKVYFVDDKFVIKKIEFNDNNYEEDMIEAYNNFCEEIQSFGDAGLSVPKIYSWHVVDVGNNDFEFYILQERVQGRRLFESDIENIYSRCSHFCSKEDFLKAIKNKEENRELFGKIVYEYILSFIETNKKLLQMDDEVVEQFIKTDFKMSHESLFGYPDMHGENILIADNHLTIVDNFFHGLPETRKVEEARISVLKQMLLIFYYNEAVKRYSSFDCSLKGEFKKLKQQNFELCYLAMQRFVRKTNETIMPVVKHHGDMDDIEASARKALNAKYARKLCSIVERDFW